MKIFCFKWSKPSPVYQSGDFVAVIVSAETGLKADKIFSSLNLYDPKLCSNFTLEEINLAVGDAVVIQDSSVVYYPPRKSVRLVDDALWECLNCHSVNDLKLTKCRYCQGSKPEC